MLNKIYTIALLVFVITCANVEKRKGCITGNCDNGNGTFIDPEDGKYIGEFRDGNFNGRGSFASADGDKYTGNFKDGLF
ncbi:MAG TPA: hypothetical protein PLF66_23975, partial [Leptospiraceae bacterium]|nr:hypothetical protein [Leptospiraceae bacterium]